MASDPSPPRLAADEPLADESDEPDEDESDEADEEPDEDGSDEASDDESDEPLESPPSLSLLAAARNLDERP